MQSFQFNIFTFFSRNPWIYVDLPTVEQLKFREMTLLSAGMFLVGWRC